MKTDEPTRCTRCDGTGEIYNEKEYDESHWRECDLCDGYGIEPTLHSRRCYVALVTEARRIGWPTNYREDLTVHDRRFCDEIGPDTPIAWILRESGTHTVVVTDEPIDGAGHTAWGFIRSCFGPPSGIENCRFYGWDGYSLREYPDAEMLASWVYDLAYSNAHRRKDSQAIYA